MHRQLQLTAPTVDVIDVKDTKANSLDLAAAWLQHCLQFHVECRTKAESGRRYPARLIEISGSGVDLEARLCLRPESTFQYVTLSHRWHGLYKSILTQESLMIMSRQHS